MGQGARCQHVRLMLRRVGETPAPCCFRIARKAPIRQALWALNSPDPLENHESSLQDIDFMHMQKVSLEGMSPRSIRRRDGDLNHQPRHRQCHDPGQSHRRRHPRRTEPHALQIKVLHRRVHTRGMDRDPRHTPGFIPASASTAVTFPKASPTCPRISPKTCGTPSTLPPPRRYKNE